MRDVSMKEFCDLEGFAKHSDFKNLSDLADACGVSVSYISKLYNSCPIGSLRSQQYQRVVDFVKQYNYNLILLNPLENMKTTAIKENTKLKQEIKQLKEENESLKELLFKYKSFERIAIAIANDTRLVSPRKKKGELK